MVGQVSARSFTIRKVIWYSNYNQPRAIGSLIPEVDGTRIEVRLAPGRWAMLHAWLGLAAVGIMVATAMAGLVLGWPGYRDDFPLLLAIGLGAIGFAIGPQWFVSWLARDEPAFLLNFLKQTLEAEEVGTEGRRS